MKKFRFYTSFFVKNAIIIALLGGENIFANNHSDEIFSISWKNSDLNFTIENTNEHSKVDMRSGTISGKFNILWVGKAEIKNSRKMWENDEILKIIFSADSASIGLVNGNIDINKKTFAITGTISSNMGELSLENIVLNNPNTHLANIGNLKSHHKTEITINNPQENKIYELEIYFNNKKIQNATAKNNIFSDIDLSLAGKYDFILKNEWNPIQEAKNIIVNSNNISKNIENSDFFAKKFCRENPTRNDICIDGNERKNSEILIPKGKVGERMNFEIKLRDAYGNQVSGEEISLEFTKNTDIEFIVPSTFSQVNEKISGNILSITNTDYKFHFTPLTATDNNFSLEKILYNNEEIPLNFPKIEVEKPIEIETEIPSRIFSNLETETKILSKNISNKILNPKIIVKMIGNLDGLNIETNSIICTNPFPWINTAIMDECKNINTTELRWIIWFDASNSEKILKILPKISTENENLKMEFWLHYSISWRNFSTKIIEKNITIEKPNPKELEIAGGAHNIGSINENKTPLNTGRVKLLNLIRKNIAYLERNRNNFDRNYIISREHELTIGGLLAKRTYITIGKDIIIDNDIDPSNGPIAIISLSDGTNGGNIKINWAVTNIPATLIAEKSILGDDTKTNQLHIKGSIMADNICNDADNCFLKIREDFDFTKNDHKKVITNNPNKIIIEYDPSLISNPPPALENFAE